MIYLIDGSNFLGRAGVDRESDEGKRALARELASFARRQKARVVLFFDGIAHANFASGLGAVQVRFSGSASADDLIVRQADSLKGRVHVVTSDQALARRCTRREVVIVPPSELLAQLQSDETVVDTTDWERYFSDPENRSNS